MAAAPEAPTPAAEPAHGAGDDDAARRREKAEREFAESSTVQPASHDAEPEKESEIEGGGGDGDPTTRRPQT